MAVLGCRLRASAALALVAGHAGVPALSQVTPAPLDPSNVAASPPPAMWRDLAAIQILCLVHTPQGVDSGSFTDDLCQLARHAAAAGSALPVTALKLGDPRLLQGDALTLLVHASIADTPAGPIAAVSVRPYRHMEENSGLLFAAAPRAAPLADRDHITRNSPLDRALRAAMADTLPWGTRLAARPLDRQ